MYTTVAYDGGAREGTVAGAKFLCVCSFFLIFCYAKKFFAPPERRPESALPTSTANSMPLILNGDGRRTSAHGRKNYKTITRLNDRATKGHGSGEIH